MWLKNTGTAPALAPLEREFGPYVPVSISHGYTPSDPPLYWRLVDPQFNLVEIGIDPRDGHFVSFTLVLCKEVVRNLSDSDEPPGGERDGVPLFSLEPWSQALASDPDVRNFQTRLHDVPGRCRLELGDDAVRVVLSSDEVHQSVVTEGGLVWEFNAAGDLRSTLFRNLSQHDKALMEESLRNLGTPGI